MYTEECRWSARQATSFMLVLLVAALAGCSAPGMRMDATAERNSNPGGADSGDIAKRADIYAISTGFL